MVGRYVVGVIAGATIIAVSVFVTWNLLLVSRMGIRPLRVDDLPVLGIVSLGLAFIMSLPAVFNSINHPSQKP